MAAGKGDQRPGIYVQVFLLDLDLVGLVGVGQSPEDGNDFLVARLQERLVQRFPACPLGMGA